MQLADIPKEKPDQQGVKIRWWLLVWIWAVVVMGLFVAWEYVEDHYFFYWDRETLRIAYLMRDALGALLTSVFALAAVLTQFRKYERLQAEKREVDRKLKLFTSAFEHSTDGILITDLNGNIVEANAAFSRLFGYSLKEMRGQNTSILRSQHSPDALYREMWKAILEKGEWQGEMINKAKGGHVIPVWLRITPVYEGEKKIGYMGLEIDLRDRKKLEERLVRAERLAAIGRMSAEVAHEIRNPLSSVSLNAELLSQAVAEMEGKAKKEAEERLRVLSCEVDRINAICEEYLFLSSLPKPSFDSVSINVILKKLIHFLEEESKTRAISVETKLASDLPMIHADPKQLEQVFLNVIKNAFEGMGEGGVLQIETQWFCPFIRILFIDSGKGMDGETVQKIYDPFFTTKDQGTGLGLTIALKIIEDHEGKIDCESIPGKGSTFVIKLPAASR